MSEILNETFENLFHNLDSYEAIPKMLIKVSNDVVRSDFDSMKEHSICYHIAGMVEILDGIKEALSILINETKILEIDIESEMDEEQYQKFLQLRAFLSVTYKFKEEECLHTNNTVIKEHGNGYFDLRCEDCGKIWTDG